MCHFAAILKEPLTLDKDGQPHFGSAMMLNSTPVLPKSKPVAVHFKMYSMS